MIRRTLLAACAAALLAPAAPAVAQSGTVTVLVTDPAGNPVPYAWVQIVNGVNRVANDSGRAVFNIKPVDSLNLVARRVGFQAYSGWTRIDPVRGVYVAELVALPRTLDPVTVAARRDSPLARSGFYDRVERIQRGAYSARMITPEELDLRNPVKLSQILQGDRFVRVTPMNGRQVLLGRGPTCAMTILLDGQLLLGTYEEAINNPSAPPMGSLQSIDDAVPAQSIAAMEVYASLAAVPVELQRAAGGRLSQGCGLVAIWTGSRR